MPKDDSNSASCEYPRRKANYDAQRKAEWGPLPGIFGVPASEKQSTTARGRGAAGEATVGARLCGLASEKPVNRATQTITQKFPRA